MPDRKLAARPADRALEEQLTLAEIVNRVLDRGAVSSGDVMISVAGVDLVYLGLQVVLTSVETARGRFVAERLP
ncbi:MAG: gas vesicle protein [Longimicrobiales bacterium]